MCGKLCYNVRAKKGEIKMKERFYVFLDIDGTLWDYESLKTKRKAFESLNPESISALEVLLESIKNQYNLDLVITSRRRLDWWDCMDFLEFNGFDVYDYYPNRTQIERVKTPRGVKIAEYMFNSEKGLNAKKQKYFSKFFQKTRARKVIEQMADNFVVLDDDMRPLEEYIPKSNIIKTDRRSHALDMKMVETFLKSRGIEMVQIEKNEMTKNKTTEKQVAQEKMAEKEVKAQTKTIVKNIEKEPELGEE